MFSFVSDKQGKLSKIALAKNHELSYGYIQKLIRNKDIKVNGKRINKDIVLSVGDAVDIYYNAISVNKFSIIFEDANILVVFKKKGYTSEAVFEDVKKEYPNSFFIHRLDTNTDGIMIFALNQDSNLELLNGFKSHLFEKEYLAYVYGVMPKESEVLTAYLLKDSETAFVKIFDKKVEGSSLIKTGYQVLKTYQNYSLLKVKLFTGKTHQIRAHLASLGHFVLGDGKYGDNKINQAYGLSKQLLTAYSLTLHFEKQSFLAYLNNKTFTIKEEDFLCHKMPLL